MTETICVTRMGSGAEAVGKTKDGKTVFVGGGAPQDILSVEITEDKGSFARGHLISIDQASPFRIPETCPHAAQCGGCAWQHLSYDAQLQAKRENVVGALVHTAHIDATRAEKMVANVTPSKRIWGYRNKLELGAEWKNSGFHLGFYKDGTHEIVSPDICPVANKLIQKAPKSLRGALKFAQGSSDLGIFRVGVRSSVRTHDVEVALWTNPGAFPRAHVAKTIESALKPTSIMRVMADPGKARKIKGVETLFGKGCWEESLGNVRYLTSAPSFFQVNTTQAEKLVTAALTGLGNVDGMLVADLYAGGGTFSIPLAHAGANVIAVESAGSSVRDLRRNAEINNVNIDIVGGDAGHELTSLGRLDALVVDPPRSGLANGVVDSIAAAAPSRIVYVSCNPATWARDVDRFEKTGYKLTTVQPVDMFPQTPHIEVVSTFIRQK